MTCIGRSMLLALLIIRPDTALAAGFYDRSREGWFFYQVPPPVYEVKPSPAPEPVPPKPTPQPTAKDVKPAPFSVAWLRAEMGKALETAVNQPTPENVRYYLYLQRAALDKAQKYAEASQAVVQGDPYIDETSRRGTASFAVKALDKRQHDGTEDTLKALAQSVGIFFFFRSDCGPFCEKQGQIVAAMQRLYGFRVVAVSLDGKALASGLFPDTKTDQGQAAALGVRIIPAIYLVHPPSEMASIAQGIVAISDLRARFLRAAAQHGWISAKDFAKTRAFEATPTFKATPDEMKSLDIDYEKPAQVIDALRAAMKGPPHD